MSKQLPIEHRIFSGDVTCRPSPACRRLYFETVFRCCCAAVKWRGRQCSIFIIGPVAASFQPTKGLWGTTRHDRLGGGVFNGAGGTISKRVVADAPGKEYVGRRAEEKVREMDMISVGAVSHEQLAARSSRADSASTSPSTIGPTAGLTGQGKNQMRARDSPQDGWVEAGAGLRGGRRQRPALRGWGGGGAAGRKGRPSAREAREGERVADRKEGTTEEVEEQRVLYTRAKRRGSTLPDRAGLTGRGSAPATILQSKLSVTSYPWGGA